jgi:hypothetical protein
MLESYISYTWRGVHIYFLNYFLLISYRQNNKAVIHIVVKAVIHIVVKAVIHIVSVAINYVRELYFLHMARCTHLFSELFSFNFLQTHLTIIL